MIRWRCGLKTRADLLRELRYRRHFLHEDARLTAGVTALVAVAYAMAAVNDLKLLRGRALLIVALALRALLIVIALVAVILARRAHRLRRPDIAFGAVHLLFAAVITAFQLTRIPAGPTLGPLLGACVYLAVLYFGQRGPLEPRAIGGSLIALTSAAVIHVGHHEAWFDAPSRVTSTIILIVVNIIGIFSARSSDEQRRRRFEAERRERRARQELNIKLRELAAEKERAEAMTRARTAFLAAMSHEFRTPMNAVLGLSDMLLEEPLTPGHKAHVRTISESARSLLALLNDILDFAKIDAQKVSLSPAPFDLRSLAVSVVEMLGPAARARSIDLSLDMPGGAPERLIGDGARLRQILVNLVSNAVKFTERGSVKLQIVGRAVEGRDPELDFLVEDTGIGMTPEVIERLFRPFEQAEPGIARRFGGTGLGLAISKQIVAAMGESSRWRASLAGARCSGSHCGCRRPPRPPWRRRLPEPWRAAAAAHPYRGRLSHQSRCRAGGAPAARL